MKNATENAEGVTDWIGDSIANLAFPVARIALRRPLRGRLTVYMPVTQGGAALALGFVRIRLRRNEAGSTQSHTYRSSNSAANFLSNLRNSS